ncbi:hypothetical protein J1N35_022294 [Gossypium stocksii]|uniref:Uncharacterized protein n=1 Tax=Gossypium stocksii TaxID=47602 RepID=A0A9D3VGI2_9ROSI|nr:hypothetical protein J1N35_022294 [Gossypium stocksii]
MRFMREQMVTQEAWFEQQQALQHELLKQNEELRRKMFLGRFRAYRAIGNMHMGLISVKKREGKSLQGYVKSFVNHPIEVRGLITLLVTLEVDEHTTIEYVQFYVVGYPMAYNAIFRRPIIRMTKMVVITFCMKIKFSINTGVGFLRLDQQIVRQCHILFVKQARELVAEGQSAQGPKLAS